MIFCKSVIKILWTKFLEMNEGKLKGEQRNIKKKNEEINLNGIEKW